MVESGTDEAECSRKVASRRKIAGTIRPLVNARVLQLECAKVLHESLPVSALMYSSETRIWKENERSRIRAVQINRFRGLLGIRRKNKVPNGRIRKLCGGGMNGKDGRIDKGVFRWFGHVGRMENDRIVIRVYMGTCAYSCFSGRPRKRWNDTEKDCLKKRSLDIRQARKMMHGRNIWRGM